MFNPYAPYLTIRDEIVTLLKANLTVINTDLNDVLTTDSIRKGDPTVEPVPITRIPGIWVRFDGKETETFLARERRNVEATYRIFGITRRIGEISVADDEMTNMARNIEAVIRQNIDLGGTVLYCNPEKMSLAIGISDKAFMSLSTIEVRVWLNIE